MELSVLPLIPLHLRIENDIQVTNMRVAIKISPIYEEPQINELRYLVWFPPGL